MDKNDNLDQKNLNEEPTNEPVKHSKIVEAMINSSDDPEKDRKEWDEISKGLQESKEDFKNMKKDFDKMVDETNKNFEKAK